jgi:hypothetical protein
MTTGNWQIAFCNSAKEASDQRGNVFQRKNHKK